MSYIEDNNIFKKHIMILSFAIPIFIMILIFIQRGIFPFGENSFLRTDLYHQYAPFFSEFKHKLANGESLLYSWDVGLGINFSALYAYYLASPMNWLIIFCPQEFVIEFITLLIVIKTGLSGLTMAWYLRKKSHKSHKSNLGIVFFAIFYALSGYMAAYTWNVMWLDCIVLLPLICYGLEQLVYKGRGFLYAITLGISILSNYYISIMICIFMVIYFIMLLILRDKRSIAILGKTVLNFIIFSLIAGGIAAAVFMPEVYALSLTASSKSDFPKTFQSYFSIIDMLARHIGNIECEEGLDHWPNIFCGVAIYLTTILYILNTKIKLKEKIVYLVAILFFLASFSINVLNYIWHGMHYPNSLPARQSFIYIFLLLVISYRTYERYRGNSTKHIAIAFLISESFILLCQKFITNDDFHFAVFYVAMILIGIYALLMYMRIVRRYPRWILGFAALVLVCSEAAANTAITSVVTTSRIAYKKEDKDVRAVVSSVDDGLCHRFDKISYKSKDDGAWYNYPSVSIFSSTAYASMSDFFKKIGCEGSTNAYCIKGSTPLVDAFLSVKYGIFSEIDDNPADKLVTNEGSIYLYEYPDTLPIAYLTDSKIEDWMIDLGNAVDVQNNLCNIYGYDGILEKVDSKIESRELHFTADRAGKYYIEIYNSNVKSVKVIQSDTTISYDNLERGYLIELPYCEIGDTYIIKSDNDEEVTGEVYRFDYDILSDVADAICKVPLQITEMTDNKISGNIESDEAALLMTSIPYDPCWIIKLDGEIRTPRIIADTWLAADIPSGSHDIEMIYIPQGYNLGRFISVISIIILFIIYYIRLKGEKHETVGWKI